jgi:hypothetical protein
MISEVRHPWGTKMCVEEREPIHPPVTDDQSFIASGFRATSTEICGGNEFPCGGHCWAASPADPLYPIEFVTTARDENEFVEIRGKPTQNLKLNKLLYDPWHQISQF